MRTLEFRRDARALPMREAPPSGTGGRVREASSGRPLDASAPEPGTRADVPWLVYLGLVALAIALRLAASSGSIGSDDVYYANYAKAIAEGHYAETLTALRQVEHVHYALRFGLLLPVAAVYMLFGVSEWTTMVPSLLASVLSVVLLAEITRRLFGVRVAVIAGLLYATFPIHMILGGMLAPETLAECYVLGGVLVFLHARERGGIRWFCAGLLMGTAYLAKEPALFVGGAFLLVCLLERRWTGAALFAAGVAAIGAIEHAYYVAAWGDLMFRPNATRLFTLPVGSDFFTSSTDNDLAYRLFRKYPRMMLLPHLKFGLHSIGAIAAAAAALVWLKPRGARLLALWAVVPFLYLNFGSWSFEVYAPLPTDPRYIEFVYPPLFVLSAVLIAHLMRSSGTTARVCAGVLGIVLAVGMFSGILTRGTVAHAGEMAVLREIAATAAETPGQTLYTPVERWRRALSVFYAPVFSASPEGATLVIVPDAVGLPSVQGMSLASPGLQ